MNSLRVFARIRESAIGMAGFAVVVFWLLVAVFADLIAPFDPLQQIAPLAKPGTEAEGGVL
ncbi:MAG: ABC transporter permease, partial [Betaproteobacteria bacterium]|nr:ABC transporter permease [Betaproteobacteria bacterium]